MSVNINPSFDEVLDSGRELRIVVNGNLFVMVREGHRTIANVNGETHNFDYCRENEIKSTLEEWRPGAWKGSA